MMKRVVPFILALVMALLCLTPVLAETKVTTMYVYTDNRKPLNVRTAPYVANNIIATAPFGTALSVLEFRDDGWARIQWTPTMEAYVQSRYLQWNRPDLATAVPVTPAIVTPSPTPMVTVAPYISGSTYTGTGYTGTNYTSTNYASTYTDSLITLNAEFRTARLVTPFAITVRPARASGWVNMRWAPSKDVELITTYRSGAQLTVIAETQSWYQVVDPDSEATGFIMKAYTTRTY